MSMDRLKFRVAVKQGLEWQLYDVLNILFKNDGTIWVQTIRESESATFTAWMLVDGENVILEQYTGLTDKNGKLIYEGDIVSFAGVTMFVEWSETSCRWVLRYTDKRCSHYWETMSMCPPSEDYYPNEYIVIGNIHEMEVTK